MEVSDDNGFEFEGVDRKFELIIDCTPLVDALLNDSRLLLELAEKTTTIDEKKTSQVKSVDVQSFRVGSSDVKGFLGFES